MGSVVGVPNPRSDWNQIDETKADFIKNKPNFFANIKGWEIDSDETYRRWIDEWQEQDVPKEVITMYYEPDGYSNAPFVKPCMVINEVDGGSLRQVAVSFEGEGIKTRGAISIFLLSDEDKWSDNIIPTKVSQLTDANDYATKEFVEELRKEHVEHLYGEEIDTKYKVGEYIPSLLLYENYDDYENAPFIFDGIIVTHSCMCGNRDDTASPLVWQCAISYDGKIKHRIVGEEEFADVPWSDNFIPTKLSQLEDDIGFADVKSTHDTLMDGGWDADTIISAFESAFEACQIANENVGRIKSVETGLNANALKGSVSDSIASLCDVSPTKHKVKITTDASVNSVTVKGANLFDVHSASLVSSNGTCSVEMVDEGHIKVTNLKTGNPQYGRASIPLPISSPKTVYVKFSARVSDTELSNPLIYVGYRNSASSATSNKTTSTGITTEWKEYAVSVSVTSDAINQYDELMLLVYTKYGSAAMNNVGVYVEVKDIMISTSDSEYIPYESSTHNVKNGVCEVDSIYPSMSISTDVSDAVIKADYNRDINKAFAELQAMILGG